jgi:FAD:protein FMN transferase
MTNMITKRSDLIKIILICLLVLAGSCTANGPKTETAFLLGTTCSVTLFSGYPNSLFEDVFTRVREIERKMSVTVPASEVSEINRNAGVKAVSVSDETYGLIEEALRIAGETQGALDITVGPLVGEWGIGTDGAHVPSEQTVETLLSLVDCNKVELDSRAKTVFLPKKGMKIDLGAIAKGFAADEAVRLLRDAEVARGIIDFGGNIVVFGRKQGKDPWRVGIQQPDDSRGKYFGIVQLEQGAVVSSGTYERYFVRDGIRYHHILDPAVGYPVRNGLESVSIVAQTGTHADGYSTAVFVMGLEKGFSFVTEKRELEAVFVTKDKEVYVTEGLREHYVQSGADYPVTSYEAGPRQQ